MAEAARAAAKKETMPVLTVSSSPHLAEPTTSRRVMFEVAVGTLPAWGMACYLFRGAALLVVGSCILACIATEWAFNAVRGRAHTYGDGSALVTGLILGLSLPPTLPWWAAVLGSVVAIAVAKMCFGGLGSNIFNPAMVGRAFLMACFGTLMTTWVAPEPVRPAAPLRQAGQVVAVTEATPLAQAKQCIKAQGKLRDLAADLETKKKQGAPPAELAAAAAAYEAARADQQARVAALNARKRSMFLGNISGSVGETSALCWLIGGVFLLVRRTITVHIPLAVLGSALLIALLAWAADPDTYANPLVHLSGGGLMMGAFFIATDPVSCPLSKWGRTIFGIGVGALTMLIRLKGGYPEGVMYAVLLMNALTPLLDRWTQPRPLGGHVRAA